MQVNIINNTDYFIGEKIKEELMFKNEAEANRYLADYNMKIAEIVTIPGQTTIGSTGSTQEVTIDYLVPPSKNIDEPAQIPVYIVTGYYQGDMSIGKPIEIVTRNRNEAIKIFMETVMSNLDAEDIDCVWPYGGQGHDDDVECSKLSKFEELMEKYLNSLPDNSLYVYLDSDNTRTADDYWEVTLNTYMV